MTDNELKIIKEELERINEARAKATQGKWESTHSLDKRRGSVFVENKMLICDYTPDFESNKQINANNFALIALAANEITNLTKALSVAVEGLDDHDCRLGSEYFDIEERFVTDCAKCNALKTIANILSGGKDGK